MFTLPTTSWRGEAKRVMPAFANDPVSVQRQTDVVTPWQGTGQLCLVLSSELLIASLSCSLGKVTHTTELSKVDIAFRLLKLDNAYVCNAGRLVGMITRENLADFVDQREVSPMDDCVRCACLHR